MFTQKLRILYAKFTHSLRKNGLFVWYGITVGRFPEGGAASQSCSGRLWCNGSTPVHQAGDDGSSPFQTLQTAS